MKVQSEMFQALSKALCRALLLKAGTKPAEAAVSDGITELGLDHFSGDRPSLETAMAAIELRFSISLNMPGETEYCSRVQILQACATIQDVSQDRWRTPTDCRRIQKVAARTATA